MRPAAVLLVVALAGACLGREAKGHSPFDATAAADLAAIGRGDCAAVTAHFDEGMQSLTPKELCADYQTYLDLFGDLRTTSDPYSTKRGRLTVVRIPLQLSEKKGEFREAFHTDGTVAGLYFLKAGVPLPR